MNITGLTYEADEVLKDLGLKFHHGENTRDEDIAYYSVDGCDELLKIDGSEFNFNWVKIDYYGLGDNKKFNQITAAKMIKLYIEEYKKRLTERDIGAYI